MGSDAGYVKSIPPDSDRGNNSISQAGTDVELELRNVLAAMGQEPTDEELFQMIAECDKDCSGDIDMPEFLDMIERSAQRAELWDDELDKLRDVSLSSTVDIFVFQPDDRC